MKKWIQKILVLINFVFAAALILSYLSAHVSPSAFWPLAFFGLLYPILLLVNVIFILYWLYKWKKYLFISLIAVIVGYNHLDSILPNPFRKEIAAENRSKDHLKILSYNVRAFNIYEWLNDPNTDKGIFNFIRSEHPDIICLQEFYSSNTSQFSPKRFEELFGETPWNHIEYSLKKSNKTGLGIAIFSRYPIVKQGIINFNNTTNKSIFADIIYRKDTIRVINNHLQSVRLKANNYAFLDSLRIRYSEQNIRELHDLSSRLKTAFIKRSQQAKKVAAAIDSSPHPVIVCGDFNDPPVSYAYNKIRGDLKDAWMESGKSWGNTYLGRLSFRIDYILYDEIFRSVEFERVKTRLSDHYPILAVLKRVK